MTVSPENADTRWMTAWSREEGARRATAGLLDAFGVVAKGTWSAPGRVNLVGEYTDISGGVCLATVIPHRTYVAATKRDDSVIRITTDLAPEGSSAATVWEGDLDSLEVLRDEDEWMSYPAGVLWSLQERGYAGCGMDIAIASCVPISAGLSSSTSLTAAVALAANAIWGLGLPTGLGATELAEVCMDAENDLVGGATAGVAQHTILRCEPGEAIHLDFGAHPPIAQLCPLTLADYGLGLLIVDTGVRSTRQVAMVRERMAEADAAAKALGVAKLAELRTTPNGVALVEAIVDPVIRRRARHICTENERVDLVRDELTGTAPAHQRFVAVGKAIYRSHASLEVDFEVSRSELNLAVDTAFRVGALGARMVGAGDGGSAIALIRRSQSVGAAQQIDAVFQERGLARPRFAFF
ncbi:MAG: galactokinase [Demequinaceae bacterium]|nr:galactokinase [Demequinaceae bacterium]